MTKTTSKEAATGCCVWSLLLFLLLFITQLVLVILKATGSVEWTWVEVFYPTIVFSAVHILVYASVGFASIIDKA